MKALACLSLGKFLPLPLNFKIKVLRLTILGESNTQFDAHVRMHACVYVIHAVILQDKLLITKPLQFQQILQTAKGKAQVS